MYIVNCITGLFSASTRLSLDKQPVNIVAGCVEFLRLMVLAHIGLDDADGADILLHAGVEVVVFAEYLPKYWVRIFRDEKQQPRPETTMAATKMQGQSAR